MQQLRLKYDKPARNSVAGWENESLPLGNGQFGVSVFGGTELERLCVNDPTLFTKGKHTGYRAMCSLAELYFKFPHKNVTNYERGLDLNTAKAYVAYECDGVLYKREYFTSYPSKLLVMKFTASQKGALNFSVLPEVSYVKDYHQYEGDGGGKTGTVTVDNGVITLKGHANWFHIDFEAQVRVLQNSGEAEYTDNGINIKNADEVVLLFGESTSYQLSPALFLEEDDHKKLKKSDPHPKVEAIFHNAKKSYAELEEEHLKDYQDLFFREQLDLADGQLPDMCTDKLLLMAKETFVPYLEQLYFQFARYMMISCSRKGGVPASLQGVWNVYQHAPWGSGIWHNVNVQMNYWLSFAGNIPETFEAYVDYFNAYLPASNKFADEFMEEHHPENRDKDGENGFVVGTGATPYHIEKLERGHSGPGNVGFTSNLFWLYYDYTRDEEKLKESVFPALEQASKFLTKSVKEYDGLYLANFSASPEQNCLYRFAYPYSYYNTVGCAYDQQMLHDNAENYLKAAEILGVDNRHVQKQKEQAGKYHPVEIGWSGQVKEYGEEKFYGEIGEYCHRHISQLVGLYPGNSINGETPAWMDAAKITLNERGDHSTGWALAHRMCCRARTGEGNRVHKLFLNLLNEKTCDNLWDMHPPFQIDGNFGAAAAIAETLVQSHGEFIQILPALPDCWEQGRCKGFAVRGGFDADITWKNRSATEIVLHSKKGEKVNLNYFEISKAKVEVNGEAVDFEIIDANKIAFETKAGCVYKISGLSVKRFTQAPSDLNVDRDSLKLTWAHNDKDMSFNVYRACDSEPCYTKIASEIKGFAFTDNDLNFGLHETVKYKVTAVLNGEESEGVLGVINHATQLEYDRYKNSIYLRMPNPNIKLGCSQLRIPEE